MQGVLKTSNLLLAGWIDEGDDASEFFHTVKLFVTKVLYFYWAVRWHMSIKTGSGVQCPFTRWDF